MGVTCIIEFDNNPLGTYYAGQVLTGKVTLKLDKVKLVAAVNLNITGIAETHWTESRGSCKNKSSETYSGREDFMFSQIVLVDSNLDSHISLEPGVHVYAFASDIPFACPSSIEGHYGRVRYMTKVSLIRPWKFDQNYTRCFTVLKVMDLNYDSPLLKVSAQCETEKTYCCWPCQSAPLQMQMTLSQTGFVPGQSIPVGLLINNESHIRVEQLQISLSMLVTYHATHLSTTHSQNERFVLTKMMGDPVPNHCKKQFNYLLRVPATPPTCFNLCTIIHIGYQVEVETKVTGCHRNKLVSMPVTIGSVPLAEHIHMQPHGLDTQSLQTLDVMTLGNSEVMATTTPNPPPNYEEALHMRSAESSNAVDKIQGTAPQHTLNLDGSGYIPLYPVFDVPSPTAPVNINQNVTASNLSVSAETNVKTWL